MHGEDDSTSLIYAIRRTEQQKVLNVGIIIIIIIIINCSILTHNTRTGLRHFGAPL
jgi:t-SNARE complex subunit (syntaxin)